MLAMHRPHTAMRLPSAFLTRLAAATPSCMRVEVGAAAAATCTSKLQPAALARIPASERHASSSAPSSSTPLPPTAPLVFGVGVDIAHIPRFALAYDRHGMRFLRKCLHPDEIAQMQRIATQGLQGQGQPQTDAGGASEDSSASALPFPSAPASPAMAAFLASRWAAKEAFTKASGQRLLFPEMRVQPDTTKGAEDPRAHLHLSGAAAAWLSSAGLHPAPLLSLSHDGEYAVAFVCLQRQEA